MIFRGHQRLTSLNLDILAPRADINTDHRNKDIHLFDGL
jgi:hypothetical protein